MTDKRSVDDILTEWNGSLDEDGEQMFEGKLAQMFGKMKASLRNLAAFGRTLPGSLSNDMLRDLYLELQVHQDHVFHLMYELEPVMARVSPIREGAAKKPGDSLTNDEED